MHGRYSPETRRLMSLVHRLFRPQAIQSHFSTVRSCRARIEQGGEMVHQNENSGGQHRGTHDPSKLGPHHGSEIPAITGCAIGEAIIASDLRNTVTFMNAVAESLTG